MTATVGQDEELQAALERIAELERENARLTSKDQGEPTAKQRTASRFSWRSFISALLIILGTVLMPVALVAGWARTVLVDETTFVSTLAPIASEPAVREEVVRHVTAAIDEQLDIDNLVGSAFDGVSSLGLPGEATFALTMLRGPAADGVRSLIDGATTKLVNSEAFQSTWTIALSTSHRALVTTASGSVAGDRITVGQGGDVVFHLGPVIAEVKAGLVAQGFEIANQIPEIDSEIVIAQSDALGYVGPIYGLAVSVGWILPFVSLGLFVAGIALARNRRAGVLGSGLGLIVGAVFLLGMFAAAQAYLSLQSAQTGVSPAAIDAIFEQVVAGLRRISGALLLIGVLVVVLGWVTGRSGPASAIRGVVDGGNSKLAVALHNHGSDGGPLAKWLLGQRVLTRAVLVALVVLALVLLPVTAPVVIWTAIIGLLLWWVLAVLENLAVVATGDQSSTGEVGTRSATGTDPEPQGPAQEVAVS